MTAKHLRKNELERLIRERQFEEIFIDYLNWDGVRGQGDVPLDMGEEAFAVRVIAQKRDFAICFCDMGEKFDMSASERKKFSRKLSRIHYEHLLIAVGDGRQRWSVAIRPQNRPLKLAEVKWNETQDIQPLLEKLNGLIFSLSDENLLKGITDVVDIVHSAFIVNAESVSGFYDGFRGNLSEFTGFIEGIREQVSREWYAALMLNRLMFIYFIQKKGFLDGNPDYLQDRLRKTKDKYGEDTFHSHFYRDFLRHLFHEGLDKPVEKRADEINELLGKVPYLNGGLFDTHPIERKNEITIPDEAFEKLFNFFDIYHWHLDDRPAASGRDINPDVIGHIFEKYINNRAEMGAYYTQEDITGYITRNTIIPFLLRRVQKEYPAAFASDGGMWQLLRDAPDNYIYPVIRHGCDLSDKELPDYIQKGLDTEAPDLLNRRRRWNEPADPQFALPTETWREVIARRNRYFALRDKISAGEVCEIDDLITNNLDIQRFAEDALSDCGDTKFIRAFFAAIVGRQRIFREDSNVNEKRGISVLDPACGSGAFLFAALRVLEPLYERCVERMGDFVMQDNRRLENEEKGRPKHSFFRAVLTKIHEHHSNERYWIYKTIILHNLFGVDIMPEATEIAKLRLFLKLAAEAEYTPDKDNLGLEPLPDIDYNIRAGNSLVGFTNTANFEEVAGSQLELAGDLLAEVIEDAKTVAAANKEFRRAQDESWNSYVAAKEELAKRLKALNNTLDKYLARHSAEANTAKKLQDWKNSHQPFHWMAEFYGIMENKENGGGFDVVVGNPPYIGTSKIKYLLPSDLQKLQCPDVYGHFLTRSYTLTSGVHSRIGCIIMHNLAFHNKFRELRNLIKDKTSNAWFSFYGRIPSGLFSGDVRVRNCIFLADRTGNPGNFYTTRLHRWNARFRDMLFLRIGYTHFDYEDVIPMFNDHVESGVIRIDKNRPMAKYSVRESSHCLFFKQSAYNWISVSPSPPPCFDGDGNPIPQTQVSRLVLTNAEVTRLLFLLFNGKLFLAYWLIYGDEFHLTAENLLTIRLPIEKICREDMDSLLRLANEMESQLEDAIQFKLNAGKRVGSYNTAKLWHITDQSDMIFLKYLTDRPNLVFESILHHVCQTVTT